jgi:Tol biopolymer transport system component
MSFSLDGKRLLYAQVAMTWDLVKVAFDPSTETIVGQPFPMRDGRPQQPTLSPDGRWLVFFALRGKQEDIFVIGIDGKGLRQLTDDTYKDRQPRWSPDGMTIAFYSNRGGTWQIWTIHPDGSGLTQLTHEPQGIVNTPVWSPDGSRLAYSVMDVNSFIIDAKKPWSNQSALPLPRLKDLDAYLMVNSWSPDGRELAGDVQRLGASAGIGVYSLETHEYKRLTQMGRSPYWLSDSRRLLFVHSDKLYVLDSRSGRLHEILSLAPQQEGIMAVPSRDDRWIYLALRTTEADIWQMSLGQASY